MESVFVESSIYFLASWRFIFYPWEAPVGLAYRILPPRRQGLRYITTHQDGLRSKIEMRITKYEGSSKDQLL
ncbi:MAG: hypothetical protein A2X67_08165 [Ignavibacteria bacterium GWA2_55_11]|nr:MAG: hypothetical protein A2X67_08165 [Ignavibacteria bacterium GWA2_55_11]OGU72499.1 MAG: hypothetical protein A3H45_10255 [Ignavibacteria bacterium RIFCSPLOWO2_02_FULL_55_14]OGU72908.1 MAG: hypothetical protein A3G43_08380 [Ignavibacteria bacterium RIFCSPLOWO2_12_FULL_56_21]HAV23938.1 hypothetical protein [Bacteroidota bacterium]